MSDPFNPRPQDLAGGMLISGSFKTFKCPKGHTLKGPEPPRMTMPINQSQVIAGPPFCPVCHMEFIAQNCPISEVKDEEPKIVIE